MTDNLYSDKGQSNYGAKPFTTMQQDQLGDQLKASQQNEQFRQQQAFNPLQAQQQGFNPTDPLDSHFGADGGQNAYGMPPLPPPPPPPPAAAKGSMCFLL